MKKIILVISLGLATVVMSGCSEKEMVIYKGMSQQDYQRAHTSSEEAFTQLDKE
jgi:hypothetical protein